MSVNQAVLDREILDQGIHLTLNPAELGGVLVSQRFPILQAQRVLRMGKWPNARRVGEFLMDGLRALQASHECIGDVRGHGLFLGVEIVRDREARTPDRLRAKAIVEAMKALHVLLSTEGPKDDVLKIKPPIVFSQANAEEFLDKLDQVLGSVWAGDGG